MSCNNLLHVLLLGFFFIKTLVFFFIKTLSCVVLYKNRLLTKYDIIYQVHLSMESSTSQIKYTFYIVKKYNSPMVEINQTHNILW